MEPNTYVLRFEGEGVPDETEGGIRVRCRAHGCTIATGLGANGEIRARLQTVGSEIAELESLVIPCGESEFEESGTISFEGGKAGIRFESIGKGHIIEGAHEGLRQGTAAWRIVDGSGPFAGATGVITSNFLITEDRHIVDYQVGVIYLES